jgi:small subunit ribosomal protein S17
MPEEEKQEETADSTPGPAEDAEAPQEQPAAEAAAPVESEAEAEDSLGPKEKRKLERSRASGPPRPARSPQERATERSERRRAAAERRRRHRAPRRRKGGEAGVGTPPSPREPGPKKIRQGTVVSTGGDRTITVEIDVARRHRTYEKVVRRTSRLRAHDQENQAKEGDVVRVVEARPISRTKRWRLLEILERAPR